MIFTIKPNIYEATKVENAFDPSSFEVEIVNLNLHKKKTVT